MRLLSLTIVKAPSCDGLLDGLEVPFRRLEDKRPPFDPLCLIGPNGSGKSQFLQFLAQAFQLLYHLSDSDSEPEAADMSMQFELQYATTEVSNRSQVVVHVTYTSEPKKKTPTLRVTLTAKGKTKEVEAKDEAFRKTLPKYVIGYTSGQNETLSTPFYLSRSHFARKVRGESMGKGDPEKLRVEVPHPRLMMIDFSTHIEVLIANLLFDQGEAEILERTPLAGLRSFRCVMQLAHRAAPKIKSSEESPRKGVQLSDELELFISQLCRVATCFDYNEAEEIYTLDFLLSEATAEAVRFFFETPFKLYTDFHQMTMLNDLILPKQARTFFGSKSSSEAAATRLPEPLEEDKVFRFKDIKLATRDGSGAADYISLSDGEHQRCQILGVFAMLSDPNVLFLLDEPESHFNPDWRVRFITRLLNLQTPNGKRGDESPAALQDCLLTTHGPFVPSDLRRDRVFVFQRCDEGEQQETGCRVKATNPNRETYGATFDRIIEDCFGVRPPVSKHALAEIEEAKKSDDPAVLGELLKQIGDPLQRALIAEKIEELENGRD